jgi:anti-sigma factor RsiW
MSACLDKPTLAAFARGDLNAAANTAAETHLQVCLRCAKMLAELDVGDDLVPRLRSLERAADEPTRGLLRELEQRTTSTLFGADEPSPPR